MIELKAVHRHFEVGGEEVRALDDVDLELAAGEYVSIMGPSGSGKSTLLNVIGLLDRPTAGRYLLDGRDTTELDDDALADVRARKIGFVFQMFPLVPRRSAFENVELPLVLAGAPTSERRERVNALLESFDLTSRAHHRPDQLSGGQRQRVAIARSMVMQPRVLLADEPTGNLDHASGADVLEALERLNDDGILLIVVTHDLEVASRSRRHVRMRDGKVVEDYTGEVAAP